MSLYSVLPAALDALIILVVLGLSTVLGIVQECRAEAAVDLLRTRLEINARVLRDGAWTVIPASRLVPGDALHLRVGDFVPADVVVHEGAVTVDQSTLTGESVPVGPDPGAPSTPVPRSCAGKPAAP